MSDRLVQVGEKATQEMAEFGDEAAPEFDSAAAEAARAAGRSEAEIVDILGYLPPPLAPTEPAESEASGSGFAP